MTGPPREPAIAEYVAASVAYHQAVTGKRATAVEASRVTAAYRSCTPRERAEAQRRLEKLEKNP